MNLDERLTRIRAKLNADYYGEHRRRKTDGVPPLPERSPEFAARIERALNMSNINVGHDHDWPVNFGALEALNEAIRPTISWHRRFKQFIAIKLRKLAEWLLDICTDWMR